MIYVMTDEGIAHTVSVNVHYAHGGLYVGIYTRYEHDKLPVVAYIAQDRDEVSAAANVAAQLIQALKWDFKAIDDVLCSLNRKYHIKIAQYLADMGLITLAVEVYLNMPAGSIGKKEIGVGSSLAYLPNKVRRALIVSAIHGDMVALEAIACIDNKRPATEVDILSHLAAATYMHYVDAQDE